MQDMSLDAWIAVGVVLTIFPLMTLSRLGPDIILLGAVVVLMTLGVIDPQQALGGFSTVAYLPWPSCICWLPVFVKRVALT